MGSIDYDVVSYSLSNFQQLLTEVTEAASHFLDVKVHCAYFHSYFCHPAIAAKTILVEKEYIDRDFLADYSGYYVRCFRQYRRWCARFHFFSSEFTSQDFETLLNGAIGNLTAEKLQDSYLGFTIAKPLPETIFGRTCVKTYPTDGTGRDFPNIRDYKVNLFGIKLSVKTIAFQEQDTVAAACATSAIWTAFQGTGVLFQHQIPSPLTITRSAIKEIPTESRAFPAADGLSDTQIVQAIRSVGLDPSVIRVDSNWVTKSVLYAYLRAEIPLLFLCASLDLDQSVMGLTADQLDASGHAITAVGFRIDDSLPPEPGPLGFLLRSSKLTRLYVHDDQIGPFTRVEFEPNPLTVTVPQPFQNQPINFTYGVDWLSAKWGTTGDGRIYVADKVVVPIISAVRIPFLLIFNSILHFDRVVEMMRANQVITTSDRLEWDIYLTSANAFKHDLLQDAKLSGKAKSDALLTALPRFLWRATASIYGCKKVDFIFDTTDIEQGPMLIKTVSHDDFFYVDLLLASVVYSNHPHYPVERLRPQGKIWEHLLNLAVEYFNTLPP